MLIYMYIINGTFKRSGAKFDPMMGCIEIGRFDETSIRAVPQFSLK